MNRIPKGPKTPKLLQKVFWVVNPIAYLENNAQNYGEIFRSSAYPYDSYMVGHPQVLQKISTEVNQFIPGQWNAKVLEPLLGSLSVSVLSGEAHQRQRQLLIPPFHGERMHSYGELICRLVKEVMNQLPMDRLFAARTVMQEISLQVILQVVFGVYQGERYQKLKQQMSDLMEIFESPLTAIFIFVRSLQWDLGPWSPWGRFLRLQESLNSIFYAEIAERRLSDNSHNATHRYRERTDILSMLVTVRDQADQPMTDRELRDQLMTLMVAGHETTATAMAWALYWTHYFPEVGEKLRLELNTLGENPNPVDIVKLPYLNAVCNETLRIYPVGISFFPREVREPVELLGYELPAGSVLTASIYLLHQREDIYPEPKKFKPERFLERSFSPYEFMPFGGGARSCIGSALAQYEMKLVLATILSNYQLELVEKRPVKPQRRNLTLAPAGGVKMIMRGKRQN